MVRVFYKEKFEYKCMVRHVDAQKKISRQNKNRQFFQEHVVSLRMHFFAFLLSSPQAAAAAWLHQLKLMTETTIHKF